MMGKINSRVEPFQVAPGDWKPNYRYRSVWKSLPTAIEPSGAIPGLWLAPLAVYSGHDLVKNHPDWFQRLPDGNPAVTFSNWGWCAENMDDAHKGDGKTWYLDPDHPRAKEFITEVIRHAVEEGWKYLKLDFVYPISTARQAYDQKKTSFETLRELFRLFREAAGEDTITTSATG